MLDAKKLLIQVEKEGLFYINHKDKYFKEKCSMLSGVFNIQNIIRRRDAKKYRQAEESKIQENIHKRIKTELDESNRNYEEKLKDSEDKKPVVTPYDDHIIDEVSSNISEGNGTNETEQFDSIYA